MRWSCALWYNFKLFIRNDGSMADFIDHRYKHMHLQGVPWRITHSDLTLDNAQNYIVSILHSYIGSYMSIHCPSSLNFFSVI